MAEAGEWAGQFAARMNPSGAKKITLLPRRATTNTRRANTWRDRAETAVVERF